MILKRRVSLNNAQLDELDDRIIITGIDEAAGKASISASGTANNDGQRITQIRRDTLDVTIKFSLNIKNDNMAARSALLERINLWATGGGWLRIGHKPDRMLLVTLAQAPGAGDMFNWTNEFSIVFRAYSVPFWESESQTIVNSGVAASGGLWMSVPGNTRTVLKLNAENRSGAVINNIRIVTVQNGQANAIQFSGLDLRGGQTLTIDYNQTQSLFVVRNRIGNTSVMSKKTAGSADEFVVSPGTLNVQWSADRAIMMQAVCRGRYL